MHEDQLLKLKHGDILVGSDGKFCYRFRCEPVTKWGWFCHIHPKPGKQPRAYGSMRYPHTIRTFRWAEAHRREGIKVRPRANKLGHMRDAYDDFFAHNEKCWKRHRKTQWKFR